MAVALERGFLLRRPGVVLGSVLLLVAADALLWSIAGPSSIPVLFDRVTAVVVGLLGLVCIVVAPSGHRWVLEASTAASAVLLTIAMATRVTPQGVVTVGVVMLMLLATAATFLPTARLAVGIAAGLAGLALGIALNEVTVGLIYIWITGTAIAAVPLIVSALMAELRSLVDIAAEAAVTDPLTGTLNRRGLVAEADAVHAVTARVGTPTSVVAIDLDGFKSVNDSHGHAAGDAVLVALVQAWTLILRAGDVLGRTGGDEFLVVLPNTDSVAAASVVDRLRAAHPFSWSCGIVDWDPDEDLDAAMARADVLLYDEKARRAPTVDLRGAVERAQSD